MGLESVGQNIRKARKRLRWRQEDLAEKTGLSPNYIGSIERGEKLPSLDTFVHIINVLGVSSGEILCDVVNADYAVKTTALSEKLQGLSRDKQEAVWAVVDAMVSRMK